MTDNKIGRVQGLGPWKDDFLASVVVFLVALPLCMGIAIASGLPPAAGIVTGIIGGLVVGFLSGSPLQVSGPAAGLSVIVWEVVQLHGVETLGVIVVLAGAFQLVAGLLKLGQWFRAISPAVITGMLAGIGVLIFASQFHVVVDSSPRGSGLENLLSIPEAIRKGLFPSNGSTHHLAAYLGVLTIAVMVLWKSLAPKKWQVIPGALVAVALATAVAAWFDLPERGVRCVELPANLLAALRWPTPETVRQSLTWPVLAAGLTVAVVASAETLLSAAAVDQMHHGPRTRYDRELAAQGVGNMLCGLVGALPMTGVIVRSAANVQAGARTRASAILHGLWLLVFVSLLPFVLEWVPTASLAAILVYTGYKLVNPQTVRSLWGYGRGEVVIYAATVLMIVVTDLLTGILVGFGLSLVKLLYNFSHLTIRLEEDELHGRTVLFLEGAATFLRLPRLAAVLETVPPGTELHVHFEELRYIDHACLDLLMSWEKRHEAAGGSLVLDWESLTARFHSRGRNGSAGGTPALVGAGRNGDLGNAPASV